MYLKGPSPRPKPKPHHRQFTEDAAGLGSSTFPLVESPWGRHGGPGEREATEKQ